MDKTVKINFGKLMVEEAIDCFAETDMRKSIGNMLHRMSATVPTSDLARKIYHSEGEVEIPAECFPEFMDIISKSFRRIVVAAIESEVNKQLNDKEG